MPRFRPRRRICLPSKLPRDEARMALADQVWRWGLAHDDAVVLGLTHLVEGRRQERDRARDRLVEYDERRKG